MGSQFVLVKTTYPNLAEAKNLAKILLEKKLAACVQISKVQSIYSWQNKIEEAKEFLVEIKTRKKLFEKISEIIKENHSYELPEILKIDVAGGDERYLAWIVENTD